MNEVNEQNVSAADGEDIDIAIHPKRMGLHGIFRNILAYYFGAYIILVTPFVTLAVLLLSPFPKTRYRFLHFWISLFVEWFTVVYGVKMTVDGRDAIDLSKNYLVVANHRSWLDVVCILTALKPEYRLVFMIKEGLAKIPMFGLYMKWAGYVTVSRAPDRKRQNQQQIETAVSVLASGHPLLIFPEGTRTPTHRFERFRRGAAEIALRAKTPILPIVVSGTPQLFPRGTPFMRPGPVRVEFLPPIEVGDDATVHTLNAEMYSAISRRYRIEANGPAAESDPELLRALSARADPRMVAASTKE